MARPLRLEGGALLSKIIADQEGCPELERLDGWKWGFLEMRLGSWLNDAVQEEMELSGICSGWRVSIGIGDPFPEITIGKEIPAKQRDKVGERPPSLERNCSSFRSTMAMSAVQIWICTALALVPTKVLILRFCLIALKKSSICQRCFSAPVCFTNRPNSLRFMTLKSWLKMLAFNKLIASLPGWVGFGLSSTQFRARSGRLPQFILDRHVAIVLRIETLRRTEWKSLMKRLPRTLAEYIEEESS